MTEELPGGKTCGHCVHERRCCAMFGHSPEDIYCDFFPSRFREKVPNAALKPEGEDMTSKTVSWCRAGSVEDAKGHIIYLTDSELQNCMKNEKRKTVIKMLQREAKKRGIYSPELPNTALKPTASKRVG